MSLTKALGILNTLSPSDADSATLAGWVSSHWNQFSEHLYTSMLNVSAPVSFSNDISATFKAGGKYVRTTRANNVDEDFAHYNADVYANPAADNYFSATQPNLSVGNVLKFTTVMDNNFTRGKYFLNSFYTFSNGRGFPYVIDENKYNAWLKLSEQSWAIPIQYGDSWKDDWNGAEQFSAGYLMGTFNIGPQLTVLGGLRFESYNMDYHANFTEILHTVYGDAVSTAPNGGLSDSANPVNLYHNVPYNTFNVDRTDNNVFPDVQVQYKANDWSDLRVAYTTGISRPDYTAIIPKIEFHDGAFNVGNPELKPATVSNFDIAPSFHSNTLGLLTIDAFYKVIKNEMYNTNIYYSNIAQYASNIYIPDSAFMEHRFGFQVPPYQEINVDLNNPNLGYIRGVEIDWQTNFWYLPRPLNALVLDVNYTKSGSNTAYTILTPTVSTAYDTIGGRVKQVNTYSTQDTAFYGRLIQQANDVVNAALGIDYKGFSGRMSFNMTGNVLSGVGVRPELMQYTGNIYRWDFSLKQNLPIDGLSLSLNGENIFHNGISYYQNFRLSPSAPVTKNLMQVLYSPTIFNLNLRYSF